MINYKGIFYEKNSYIHKFYEGGAHFKYIDLYKRLYDIQKIISPSDAINDSLYENKKLEFEKNNYKNNIIKINNYKEDYPKNLSQNKNKDNNNNIFVIKKKILKNDFIFNKTKSIINYNKIKNIIRNNINSQSIDNRKKNEKNNFEKSTFYSKEKNNIDETLIKLKLKKLENIKRYKVNIFFKNKKFKKANYSLPKIDSISYKKDSKENKKINNNNLSDIIDNAFILNNRYNLNNICLSSNNLKEKKNILINYSNKNYNNFNSYNSLSNEENVSNLISKREQINHDINHLNNYNNLKNSYIKESFNEKQYDKKFSKEIKNKNHINLYINTFKKYYSMKNKNVSKKDKII